MAKKPLVHCRRCHIEIDRDNQTDWVMPSKGWYYHTSCYEDFVKKKGNIKEGDISIEVDDDLWKSAVYDYLRRDLKMSVNYVKFKQVFCMNKNLLYYGSPYTYFVFVAYIVSGYSIQYCILSYFIAFGSNHI